MMVKQSIQMKRIRKTYSSVGMDVQIQRMNVRVQYNRVFGVDESDEDFDYSHGYEYTFL